MSFGEFKLYRPSGTVKRDADSSVTLSVRAV